MILTIGTRKGGAGKSTIATNLAAMRKIRGHDICLMDTDDQKNSAMWAAVRSEWEGSEKIESVPFVCVSGKGTLGAIIAQANKYDDLIIDVPGRDASELRAAAMASDVFAIPLKPSQFDLWAFKEDLKLVEETRIMKEGSGASFRPIIFFNGIHTNPSVRAKELSGIEKYLEPMKEDLDENNIEICPTYICNRGIFNKSVMDGLSVHELSSTGNSDEAARIEMESLYKFIYGSSK